MKDRFPEDNPPANDNAVNTVADSADSTVNPAQSEQNPAIVSEENVRSGQPPVFPQSISHDSPTIYNNVQDAEDDGRYTSGDAVSEMYQPEGKEDIEASYSMRDQQTGRTNLLEKK